MPTLLLHGHGTWKPDDGFTQVPKHCSISFYTHFAKLLNKTMVRQILLGTMTQGYDRTVGQFETVPNLVLSSLTAGQHTWASSTIVPNGRLLWMLPPSPPTRRYKLDFIMEQFVEALEPSANNPLNFEWLCCQSLSLNKVGGRSLGLNASDRTVQAGHGGQYLFKWVDGTGAAQTKWVQSNSSLHK